MCGSCAAIAARRGVSTVRPCAGAAAPRSARRDCCRRIVRSSARCGCRSGCGYATPRIIAFVISPTSSRGPRGGAQNFGGGRPGRAAGAPGRRGRAASTPWAEMMSPDARRPLDALDRAVVFYLALPVVIFLAGWLEPWAAVPLLLCVGYALYPLVVPGRTRELCCDLSAWQVAIAIAVGCAWTVCGGTGHWVFANADWHIRDAGLHDLVTGAWPVGYGAEGGGLTLLRAPIGYYLPAALVGKTAGLAAAHAAMAVWTAAGATLFLLQVLSRMPPRVGAALGSVAVIVSFSGLDVVGTLLRVPD